MWRDGGGQLPDTDGSLRHSRNVGDQACLGVRTEEVQNHPFLTTGDESRNTGRAQSGREPPHEPWPRDYCAGTLRHSYIRSKVPRVASRPPPYLRATLTLRGSGRVKTAAGYIGGSW